MLHKTNFIYVGKQKKNDKLKNDLGGFSRKTLLKAFCLSIVKLLNMKLLEKCLKLLCSTLCCCRIFYSENSKFATKKILFALDTQKAILIFIDREKMP